MAFFPDFLRPDIALTKLACTQEDRLVDRTHEVKTVSSGVCKKVTLCSLKRRRKECASDNIEGKRYRTEGRFSHLNGLQRSTAVDKRR